jgi:hypothetical protein
VTNCSFFEAHEQPIQIEKINVHFNDEIDRRIFVDVVADSFAVGVSNDRGQTTGRRRLHGDNVGANLARHADDVEAVVVDGER